MSELLIKINADAKNAVKAFDDVKAQSKDLSQLLTSVGQVSAVAFAAVTASIGFAVFQFNEAEASSAALTQALQNQGIFTDELATKYDTLIDRISQKNGVDDDALKGALAVGQSLIGQQEITEGLTQAVVDFAAAQKVDLNTAFEIVAKGANGNTLGFKKLGIEIDSNGTKSERLTQITEQLSQRFDGQASAADRASGGMLSLRVAFGNVIEGIGARFAPLVATITGALTNFFSAINDNKLLLDLAASFLAAAAAVTGIIAAATGLAITFLTLSAAATALGISLSVALLGIPIIIAAVVAALVFLARNWDSVTQFIRSLVTGLVTFAKEAFGGLGQIIGGIFDLDPAKISAGVAQLKNSLKAGADAYKTTYNQIEADTVATEEKQNAIKKAAADKAENERNAKENRERAALIASRDAKLAELRREAPAIVEILKEQAELKKALVDEDDKRIAQAMRQRLQELSALEADARTQELERTRAFQDEKRAFDAEQLLLDQENRTALTAQQLADLQANLLTEQEAERNVEQQKLQARIEGRNRELEDRKKYGVTIAAINKVLQAEEVQGTKAAAGELVQLQQSKSNELKTIGKAAAVAQIAIATAESAMNIYRGFSTIPIIGPALGVAGAAAAVAFGAERTSTVLAAATGGLVEGGIPGRDSVPALLEPGELVVPRRNFNDVVGAVQGGGQAQDPEILRTLQSIDSKFSQPTQNVFQGDILADDSYIDRLIDKISDRLEFGNAKLFGVTT